MYIYIYTYYNEICTCLLMCMCIYYMDIICIIVYNFVSNYTIDIPIYHYFSMMVGFYPIFPWHLTHFFMDKAIDWSGLPHVERVAPIPERKTLWIWPAKMGIFWEKGGFPGISWGHHGGYVLIFPDTWCSSGGQNWYNLGILTPLGWLGYGGPYKDGYITVYNPDCTPRYHKVRNWKLLKLLSWCWWTTFQASPGFWMVFYFQSF